MSIRVSSLTHRYGRHPSLHEVSMHVRRGDCYGFLGHNGAGKTTTLRIALGLMRAHAGRVIVDGFDVLQQPREVRARMGGLIETPGFYPDASGRHNLVELARLGGMNRRAAGAEADRLLDVTGLEAAATRKVGGYSQGMRQRLGLAQAMLGRPPYVLLDEPMNGLDPEGIAELRSVLMRLTRDEGTTVLLSSHQLQEITGLCNRVGVLRQGRLLLEAEVDALVEASSDQYSIETDDDARVLELCRARSLSCETGDSVRVALGGTAPGALARDIVGAGLELIRYEPRPVTLEEIYLDVTRGTEGTATNPNPGEVPTDEKADAPGSSLAPSRPTLRMFGFELRRLMRRRVLMVGALVPVFVAWWRVGGYRAEKDDHLAQLASGKLFETSNGTAFDATGLALQSSVPLLGLFACVVGSQFLAADLARGTLRNTLLRPLRRVQVLSGKFAAVLMVVGVSYLAAIGVAMARAAGAFGFVDYEEVFGEDDREVVAEAVDLWPLLGELTWSLVLPLCVCAAIGMTASAIFRRGTHALIAALLALAACDFGRGFLRDGGVEWLSPLYFLPSPLGDRSYLPYFLESCFGNDAVVFGHGGAVLWVPLAWFAGLFLLSACIFARRRVP